jgi:outer membrane receptor protein involved in Fe transport
MICTLFLAASAYGQTVNINVASGDLKAALDAYIAQTGVQLVYKVDDIKGYSTKGLKANLPPVEALARLLEGTRLQFRRDPSGAIVVFSQPAGEAKPNAFAEASTAQQEEEPVPQVIVTINKRRQSLQEVAGTTTSFNGAALEAAGVRDAEGVLRRAPGVQTNKGDPDQGMPTIRGVATVTNSFGIGLQQSTTGVYIEDVPFTDPIGVNITPDLAPFDLEGIDILRGPQGALYGSSSLGGAVRYTVNKPDLKNVEFSVLADTSSVKGGNFGRSLYVMANAPLSENVAGVRTVLFDRHEDGYITNLGTGVHNANTLRQRGGRVIGLFVPTPGVKVTTTLMSQETTTGDAFAITPYADQFERSSPTPFSRKDRFTLGNAKIEADLAGYTLTSSTSVVHKRIDAKADMTKAFGDIGTVMDLPGLPNVNGPQTIRARTVSQELRIASPADAKLNYVAGVFYQRYNDHYNLNLNAPGGAELVGADLVPNGVLYYEDDHDVVTEKALFVDAEYALTKAFSAGFGGRYYRNTQEMSSESHLFDAAFGPLPPETVNASQSGFTPKFNLKYKFPKLVWFAAAAKGYRFGGINFGSDTSYKSDALWSYETGVHMAPSRDLGIDVTTYLVKWNDAQVNALVGTGALSYSGIANVGKATIKGLELSGNWRAAPDLSFNFAGAYIDARTSSDFVSSGGKVVESGARLPGTAHLQTSLGANYHFIGPFDTAGRFSLSHSYMGRRSTNLDRPGELAGYSQLDARLAFSLKQWEFTVYANNLNNSHGSSGGSTLHTLAGNAYSVYYPIKPRTAGMSLRYDY